MLISSLLNFVPNISILITTTFDFVPFIFLTGGGSLSNFFMWTPLTIYSHCSAAGFGRRLRQSHIIKRLEKVGPKNLTAEMTQ